MGDALKNPHFYTVEEYETICRNAAAGERYEYADGKIIQIADEYTTNAHNLIVGNTAHVLRNHFHAKECRVYTENAGLIIENSSTQHRLPDVMVTCSPRDKEAIDTTHDPSLLAEVLSPVTAFTDLVDKTASYKEIPTLRVYLLINPTKVWVRVYEQSATGAWLPEKEYTGLSANFTLPSLELTINVQELYQMVF